MNDFSKALLRSAHTDAPAAHAKAQALAHVQRALAAAPTVATTAAAVKGFGAAKLALVAGASFVVAGAAGTVGGYELGRASAPARPLPVITSEPVVVTAPPQRPAATPAAPPAAPKAAAPAQTPAVDACSATTATERLHASSDGGKSVTFALTSGCLHDKVDVFWVDLGGREVFKGILEPGDIFWQDSWESHVFRVRDHATRRLLKEFSPAQVPGAPDRHVEWSGPRTQLPLVTLQAGERALPEEAPAECSHGGGRAAALHVKNDRPEPVVLMWVDSSCKEQYVGEIKPGAVLDKNTSEGHAYRLRDLSGALLTEIAPTSLDTATYLTVP